MHVMTLLFIMAFVAMSSLPVSAQMNQEKSHVTLKTYLAQDKVHPGSKVKAAFKIKIEDTWHINSNKPKDEYLIPSSVQLDSLKNPSGALLASVSYPAAKDLKLEFSDNPVSVFEGDVTVTGEIEIPENTAPGSYPVKVLLNYQSCNNSTCLAPDVAEDEITVQVVEKTSQVNEINKELFSGMGGASGIQNGGSESVTVTDKLASNGLFLSLLIVFLGGLALNLTPCVYPLVPITIGYFGGQSEGKTSKLFFLGALYVLGMALTYSVIGVITALSGSVFGTLLQNPAVIIAVALVLVALSLSMFGVYEFKLPDSLVAKAGGAKGGFFGAFFMGLTMGIVAAPCIGPFVLGLVTFVGAKGDPYYGFLMFFFLAVGLGLPYLFLALFSGKIKSLPRAGFWMEAVKHIFGFILLGMAIYFLEPVLPKVAGKYLLPVYMIAAAAYLFIFDKAANNVKGFRIFKTIFSVLIIAAAVYMLLPEKKDSPEWKPYTEEAFNTSLNAGKPMIIDFFADWCIPCKELDGMTFSDPKVIDEFRRFHSYKVDMTKSVSPEAEKIRNKFKILGMPTVLIIDSRGREVQRITGFVNAEKFHQYVSSVN
ncbi:MAG: protein-disulfide reductase DsbD [Ignavibacteriales bacterium]